ncbi:MAG: helix-turn-helix domain-containing protein [Bacteroidota bacterium]
MDTDTIQLLLILILFVLGMLSLFLITHPRGNRKSNTLLGILLLSWSLMLLDSLAIISGWTVSHTRLAFWTNQLFLVIGPLLYLYTRSVLHPHFRLRAVDLWHLLPFVLILGATQIGWQSLPADIRLEAVKTAYTMREDWLGGLILIIQAQFGIYLWLAFRELKRYSLQLKNNYSRGDQINLPWLRFFLWGILIVVGIGALQNLMRFLTDSNQGYEWSILISGFALLTFFVWFTLKALRQPEIFSGLPPLTPPPSERSMTEAEQASLRALADRLQSYMQEHQAFLQPDLSLKALAVQLSVSPRDLSQAINRILGQSFFDYINQHRITLAQQKIAKAEDPKITVLEIMYEVGFQSKSSFNTAFKKFTGMTPTQWKAQTQHAE